jgi:hypothetical protein
MLFFTIRRKNSQTPKGHVLIQLYFNKIIESNLSVIIIQFNSSLSILFKETFKIKLTDTVSSAIMRVSLTRIGYKAVDEQVNAICTKRTFAYACWVLRDFSSHCEGIRLDDGPNVFLI